MDGYTIGFGGKFWTLWNVWTEKLDTYTIIHNIYIQNLSHDLEEAKEKFLVKTNNAKIQIDNELKGVSFVTRERKEYTPPTKEVDEYQYGKYSTYKLIDVDDVDYLKWYYFDRNNSNSVECFSDAFNKFGVSFVIVFSFKNINEEECSYNTFRADFNFFENEKEKLNYINNYKYIILKNQIESLRDIFFYTDKEKVEKDVILISKSSVNTYYGTLYTYNFYCEEDNTYIVYGGAKEFDIENYEKIRIKGTIQHKSNTYLQEDQTKIQRMKII